MSKETKLLSKRLVNAYMRENDEEYCSILARLRKAVINITRKSHGQEGHYVYPGDEKE